MGAVRHTPGWVCAKDKGTATRLVWPVAVRHCAPTAPCGSCSASQRRKDPRAWHQMPLLSGLRPGQLWGVELGVVAFTEVTYRHVDP